MLLRTRGLLVVSSTLIKGATTTTTTNNNNAKVSILYSKRKRKNGNSCTFNIKGTLREHYGNIKGPGRRQKKKPIGCGHVRKLGGGVEGENDAECCET